MSFSFHSVLVVCVLLLAGPCLHEELFFSKSFSGLTAAHEAVPTHLTSAVHNSPGSQENDGATSASESNQNGPTQGQQGTVKEGQKDTDDRVNAKHATDALPSGHLKKLGEHGSRILTDVVEELDYMPSGKDFYTHFVRKLRPVVIRGSISDWPAVRNWGNESYTREKYGDLIFDVEYTKRYENRHPIKKTMKLREFLDIYKSQPVYLDCPFPQTNMTQDIGIPYCLQCGELLPTVTSTHLLFSSGNTSSSCHQDGYQNLLTLISGTKEVLVANGSYAEYFYPNNFTTVPGLSPIDPESVDLLKFPNVTKVPFHKVRITTNLTWHICKCITNCKKKKQTNIECALVQLGTIVLSS